MKILFLDFDGVICNPASIHAGYKTRQCAEDDPYGPDAACVQWVNHIIKQTGATIVVSSTWRMDGLADTRTRLKRWGVEGMFAGITPHLPGQERGVEIQKWLETHDQLQIESFVILDDDSDMGQLKQRLVQTDPMTGLTETDAELAIQMFNTPGVQGKWREPIWIRK